MNILFVNAADTSRHVSSANTAIYPNLGILTLMSSLKQAVCRPGIDLGYLDGTVYGNPFIQTYIEENSQSISVICFSVLTANYGASILLANLARALNPRIVTIFGNDHFSALCEIVMKKQPNVCYGFYGNDVVEGFTDMVLDIVSGTMRPLSSYHGLVYRDELEEVKRNPENPNEYNRIPLDIGRGCIKFAGHRIGDIPANACDFCGIIPGSKVILPQTTERAWTILKNAYDL